MILLAELVESDCRVDWELNSQVKLFYPVPFSEVNPYRWCWASSSAGCWSLLSS